MSTIAAVSTAPQAGGIAIIRISGPDAEKIGDKIFEGKESLFSVQSHLMQYGKVFDKKGQLIDKALCVVMRAPRSFTGEDTVEIHVHGGKVVAQKVLESAIDKGAELAMAGEFTKRAFLNGKMDLTEAEAVADIINSETDRALYAAANQLDGKLSGEINRIRNLLLNVSARLNVSADYPEEDIDFKESEFFKEELLKVKQELSKLLKTAADGKIIRDGVSCALIGRPNTGKSSLMNALLGEKRVIVTDVAGTTRDIVEERINIDGVMFVLSDTAGIREGEGEAEKIGIALSEEKMQKADICILVLDGSNITDEDTDLIEKTKDKKRIILLNKCDKAMPKTDIAGIRISAKTGEGLEKLKSELVSMSALSSLTESEKVRITNLRQEEAVKRALEQTSLALETLENGFPPDLAAIDVENAAASLGEIIGMTVSDEIIDKIFSEFCLGK